MGLGPFVTYVPPGVYTRTLTQANATNNTAGIRIPVVIGVGQQTLEQDDVELVRGSSANVDQQIINEDVTEEWVVDNTNPQNLLLGVQNGNLVTFRVRNFPIVDGQGFGRVTNNTNTVTVTVNGAPVAIAGVVGSQGLITLQVPTQPTDTIRVTYYFHRGDTSFTDTLSNQVSNANATLIAPTPDTYTVTAGQNDQFALTVNGVASTITLTAGAYTAAQMASLIASAKVANLLVSVFTDNDGLNYVQFTSTQQLIIGAGTANGLFGFTSGTQTSNVSSFQVYQRPIVDGTGGGITTTDTSKVVVKVNGTQVIPTAVDGTNGVVTLSLPPAPGSSVTVQYFANTWQDTFDYLPNSLVTGVINCGISPTRNDYLQGTDFTISNPSSDVSVISWGTSFVTSAGSTSPGFTPFGPTQVAGLLIDNKMWLGECTPVTNTTVIPAVVSRTQFVLPEIPTTGNGRDTPLGQTVFSTVTNGRQDLITNRPDLVVAYVGRTIRDALNHTPAVVTAVNGSTATITLRDPIPPDWQVWATFWYNTIVDDTYVMTCVTPGGLGSGQYTLFSSLQNTNLMQVRFGVKSGLSQTVQWPRGVETIPDAVFTGAGTPVPETITVTFGSSAAGNAAFTNRGASPYSIFAGTSSSWSTILNGGTITTTLTGAHAGWVVSGHVTPIQSGGNMGTIEIAASPANVLNLVVDTTPITVNVTAGFRTPTQIISDINAAIDANAAFSGTAPNNLAGFVQIGGVSTGDVLFYVKSYSVPSALPAGFDSASFIQVQQGTVEGTLGFADFQSATGTPGAVNKAATMLGTTVGPFNITAGLNDQLLLTVNGTNFSVTLPAGGSVAASAIVAAINAVPGLTSLASVGTLANLNKIRLTSPTNDKLSQIVILAGSSNAVLGFLQGQAASASGVTAQEIVNELNSTSGFLAEGIAYVDHLNGGQYITIESTATGAATSSVGFANSSGSAFNTTTGVGITPGTDGDDGEDAYNNFEVTSTNLSGSNGTGIPGQTYTDAQTGLRFTVLPSQVGQYASGGTFTMIVSPTFTVSASTPTYAVSGLELTVSNTVGVNVNDTGTIQTFNPSGVQPAIGDSYYISYFYQKQDFSTQLYQQLATIEANYGDVSAANRVSLAAYLAILNGAVVVGISQVLAVPNTNQASDASFVAAIQALTTPLPGFIKPDIIVPLATSTSVYSYLTQHCETQSNIRNQAERLGFIGFASGTTPTSAQSVAQSLQSNRIVAFYPDSSIITLTDETGASFESAIDGTFFAAAVAGAVVSPSVDVATPYTRRRLQGFTNIPHILDPITANQTAVKGITLLEDLSPIIRIRQGLTTNMTSILTRIPTVTQISDFVQQQSRSVLDGYVGTKFLASRVNEVVVSMTGLMKSLVQSEIIAAFTGLAANISPDDPTVLLFTAYYQPIFPLEYLVLTFNLRAQL